MWRLFSIFLMRDAGREFRHRMKTMALFSFAGITTLLAVFFALQAAQHALTRIMSPALASLSVAGFLLALSVLVIFLVWLRTRQNRSGSEIGKAMLGGIPIAGPALQNINPQLLMIIGVMLSAALFGNRVGRKS